MEMGVGTARDTLNLMENGNTPAAWSARGLLFENCSCQLVCPGHMHFDQLCTHERCLGYWAVRVDGGQFGHVPLAGAKAVIAFDAPQHMISGNWTEVVIVDEAASREQQEAMDLILTGRAGGPWEVLAKFVGRRLETRYLPIVFSEEEGTKKAKIPGLFEATVTPIRGRDRSSRSCSKTSSTRSTPRNKCWQRGQPRTMTASSALKPRRLTDSFRISNGGWASGRWPARLAT